MTTLYELEGSLYINVTNKCPCACVFCIRNNGDTIRESGSLWFEDGDPTAQQIIDEFANWDLTKYSSIVFCGYGEPLERLDTVCEVAKYVRSITDLPIRINTNGLSDLVNGREHTALELKGLVDAVSISLNAPDSARYQEITNSCFGDKSFDAMLKFAAECKEITDKVTFTVVDVISKEEIARCQEIADSMGIPLRVREYIGQY